MATASESPQSSQHSASAVPPKLLRRRSRLKWLFLLLYLIALGEVSARAYWRFSEKVPPLDTGKLIYRFYREIKSSEVETATLVREDASFDVLLLGGSAFHPDFGSVERRLAERLPSMVGRPVRVFNLGAVGRTSRDSLNKYRGLADKRFHLVVVYDGINDVRMNNCPPGRFRSDYTHCSWNLWIDRLAGHPEVGYFALPYTLEYWTIDALDSLNLGAFVPRHRPSAEWLDCGSEVRTDRALLANLGDIVDLASRRGDPLALCSFAWHLPENYTLGAFQTCKLDYAKHSMPVEMWGQPANVAKAMRMQNDAIRQLAARQPNVLFVDQDRHIEKSGRNFDDICHLTDAGSARFVDNLLDSITIAKTLQLGSTKPPTPALRATAN